MACHIFNKENKLDAETRAKILEYEFDGIIYHSRCPDGVASAYLAWEFYEFKPELYAVYPGQFPEIESGKFLMVDVSPNSEILSNPNIDLWIIDHHKTSLDMFGDYDGLIHGGEENKWSAAMMCMKIFGRDEAWVKYVSDRDTWAFKLKDSDAVNTAIYVEELLIDPLFVKSKLDILRDIDGLAERGKSYLRFKSKLVKEACEMAIIEDDIAYVNYPVFQSDVGNSLVKFYGVKTAVMYRVSDIVNEDKLTASVRSADGSALSFAKHFKGGGHKNAAGIRTTITEFRSKIHPEEDEDEDEDEDEEVDEDVAPRQFMGYGLKKITTPTIIKYAPFIGITALLGGACYYIYTPKTL